MDLNTREAFEDELRRIRSGFCDSRRWWNVVNDAQRRRRIDDLMVLSMSHLGAVLDELSDEPPSREKRA